MLVSIRCRDQFLSRVGLAHHHFAIIAGGETSAGLLAKGMETFAVAG